VPLRPRGQVFLRGELWEAEAEEAQANTGDEVIVDKVEGLTLYVSPAPPTTEGAPT
jgi:membrane protein implicated in regulation of membrane protease activity